ncbi:wd g-beta repeat-containing protein [Cyclospora cayetanensis]|uniref:Wd g-beta repeat-containing protein n=1 Tax=Cyclospora cayetanensis TaxID=88456 RepID=A0A1D3CQX6_9EIME|nr:wd g-beta repeat-containing protein [Cyclospora cayetanensis]
MLLYQGLRRAPPSFEDSGGATPQGQPPPSLGIDRPCGAVTAIEADTLYDRIFVGDAAGKIAVLSLALSPIETEPLEVCLVHCGEKRGAKMCGSSKLGCLSRGLFVLLLPPFLASLYACPFSPRAGLDFCACSRLELLHAGVLALRLGIVCTTAGWVYLWDVREQQPVAAIQPHRGTVNKILFHPSGDSLLTSSRDSSVRLLDLRTLRSLQTHKLPSGGPSACHAAGPQAGGGGPPPAGPPPLGWEPSTLAISPAQPHVFCVGDTGGFLSFFSLLQPGGPLCRIDNSGASQAGGPTAGGPQGAGGPSSRENAIVALEWAPHGAAIASASESRLLRLWGRGAPGGPVGRALNAGALLELDAGGPTPSTAATGGPTGGGHIAGRFFAEGVAPLRGGMGSPGEDEWMEGLPTPSKHLLLQFAEKRAATTATT